MSISNVTGREAQADNQISSPGSTDRPLPILAVYCILEALLTAASSAATDGKSSETVPSVQEGQTGNVSGSRALGSREATHVAAPAHVAAHGGEVSGTALHVPAVPQSCSGDGELAALLGSAVGTLLSGSLAAVAAAGQAGNPRLGCLLVVGCARAALLGRGTLATNTGAAIWEVGR